MKIKINEGHYLEIMDRLHVIMMNIQDHVVDHPLTDNHSDVKKKVKKAQIKLWEAYQLIGNKND